MTWKEYIKVELNHQEKVLRAERTNSPKDSQIARDSWIALQEIRVTQLDFYDKWLADRRSMY